MLYFRKWKEIIQNSKQQIKYLKSELSSIENCQTIGINYLSLIFFIIYK